MNSCISTGPRSATRSAVHNVALVADLFKVSKLWYRRHPSSPAASRPCSLAVVTDGRLPDNGIRPAVRNYKQLIMNARSNVGTHQCLNHSFDTACDLCLHFNSISSTSQAALRCCDLQHFASENSPHHCITSSKIVYSLPVLQARQLEPQVILTLKAQPY